MPPLFFSVYLKKNKKINGGIVQSLWTKGVTLGVKLLTELTFYQDGTRRVEISQTNQFHLTSMLKATESTNIINTHNIK